MSKTVEFYFDFGSPTTYLAWTQLPRLCAEEGATLVYKPMLLGGSAGGGVAAEVMAFYQAFYKWPWTPEQFRAAHAKAGENRGKVEYLSGPHFEGFDVIIHEDKNGERRSIAA